MNSPLTQLSEDISITRVWRGEVNAFEVVLHESGHFDIIERDEDSDEVYEILEWHPSSIEDLNDLIHALELIRDTAITHEVFDRTRA